MTPVRTTQGSHSVRSPPVCSEQKCSNLRGTINETHLSQHHPGALPRRVRVAAPFSGEARYGAIGSPSHSRLIANDSPYCVTHYRR